MIEYLDHLDKSLVLFLNGFHSPFWDNVMWFLTKTKGSIAVYVLLVYAIFKKFKIKGLWVLLGVALVIVLADQTSVHLFKNVFERLRPSHNPDLAGLLHHVNNYKGGQFGFVSSHATNTFGVAAFLGLVFRNRTTGGLLFLWAAIVSYTRIYLGVHYPGDILGGALLGILIGYLVWLLLKIKAIKFYD